VPRLSRTRPYVGRTKTFPVLLQGHYIGMLLLHGLQGADRVNERALMHVIANKISARMTARKQNLLSLPDHPHTVVDGDELERSRPEMPYRNVGESPLVSCLPPIKIHCNGNRTCDGNGITL